MSKSDRRPAVQVQLHSAYLHSMGVHDAMRLVGETLRKSVRADKRVELGVSRIDLYADVQGWPREVGDLERCVSWGENVKYVAGRLGDREDTVVETYAPVTPNMRSAAVSKVRAFLGADP